MAAGLAARRCGGRHDGHVCLLFHALAAVLDCGPCGDLEGYPLLPHGLLEEHAVAWVVLMPSSEKSFAVSSLVCLSMRTSLPRACAIRRSYARQAVCSWNPSWRDGYPSRGDLEIAAASWLAVNSPDGDIQVRFDIIDMLVASTDRALLRTTSTPSAAGSSNRPPSRPPLEGREPLGVIPRGSSRAYRPFLMIR